MLRCRFRLNVSFPDLQAALGEGTVGLHTMKDEHFGIGVVEFLASGAVALAHASAGPKMDIVVRWQSHTHAARLCSIVHTTFFLQFHFVAATNLTRAQAHLHAPLFFFLKPLVCTRTTHHAVLVTGRTTQAGHQVNVYVKPEHFVLLLPVADWRSIFCLQLWIESL